MKYRIASKSIALQNIFNSESFIDCNYDINYETGSQRLRLQGDYKEGDYLYFHGNYYEKIPLVVTQVAKNADGYTILYCDEVYMSAIDPYMYSVNSNLSDVFINEVKQNYKSSKTYLDRLYKNDLEKYGLDCSKIAIYANNIINLMHYEDRTVVDNTNVHWNVCEILSKHFHDEFGDWRRPYRYEFSQF